MASTTTNHVDDPAIRQSPYDLFQRWEVYGGPTPWGVSLPAPLPGYVWGPGPYSDRGPNTYADHSRYTAPSPGRRSTGRRPASPPSTSPQSSGTQLNPVDIDDDDVVEQERPIEASSDDVNQDLLDDQHAADLQRAISASRDLAHGNLDDDNETQNAIEESIRSFRMMTLQAARHPRTHHISQLATGHHTATDPPLAATEDTHEELDQSSRTLMEHTGLYDSAVDDDEDLERALRLSQREQAVMSPAQSPSEDEAERARRALSYQEDLDEAIRLSLSHQATVASVPAASEDDLDYAIRLSLTEQITTPAAPPSFEDELEEAIRLSMSDQATLAPAPQQPAAQIEVEVSPETYWPNIQRWLDGDHAGPRPEVSCGICMEELEIGGLQPASDGREAAHVLACHHVIGASCVADWVAARRSTPGGPCCPICSHPIEHKGGRITKTAAWGRR